MTAWETRDRCAGADRLWGVGVECLRLLILDRVAGRADEGIIAAVACRDETRHGLVVAAGMPGRGLKLCVRSNASRISMTFSLRFTRAFLGIDCMDTADSSPGALPSVISVEIRWPQAGISWRPAGNSWPSAGIFVSAYGNFS